uniref:G_PROTEIN_RECEP_F1_2 domain-containing protein n=1 Tax=Elaeophora elaphi TaxID=1147741 RepID=A0A0R3RKF2_9BILA
MTKRKKGLMIDFMDSYVQVHSIALSILCFVVGTLLLIANLPVLYAILSNIKLRIRYGILASLLLAAVIGGLSCLLRAVSIILELYNRNDSDCRNHANESFLINKVPWNCLGPVGYFHQSRDFIFLVALTIRKAET